MKTQKNTFVIILVLLFSSLALGTFSLVTFSSAETGLPDYEPLRLDSSFGNRELPIMGAKHSDLETAGGLHSSYADGYYEVEDIQWWLSLDDYYGYYYWTPFELRAINDLAEIWVQTNLSYGWDIFGGTFTDPRADPVVTDDQIVYLLDEFTNNIYPKDTEYFGMSDVHDATNAQPFVYPEDYQGSSREVILVHNFKDDAYYDPSYPYYIAGFYSPTFENYFDRNIINIDSHDWENRVGPDGDRPNLYESVIAHEYQHLIHDDWFESSETWMNEACSLFAEPLCGYELDLGQVEWFLATPDNSLTVWGDQPNNLLADYGAAFLWALFLTDHYGIDFMGRYVQQGLAGIEGVNALLPKGKNFDKVYRDWRIANLLQTDHGKYGYSLKQLRKYYNPGAEIPWDDLHPLTVHEVSGPEVPWTSAATAFGETLGKPYIPYGQTEYVQDPTGMFKLPAYGTDYIKFTNFDKEANFFFDGDEYGEVPLDAYETWTYVADETNFLWYSGDGDLYNSLIATQVDVPTTDPILEIYTYWDIEDYWDFGFVQVSTTGDWDDWTSLENEYTTFDYDPSAHPDVIANLPGLTSWSGFITPDGWVTMEFDLSAYAGETIYIGFRFVTDWATTYEGWYLDDILVKGEGVADLDITEDLEFVYPPDPEADFTVDLVIFKEKKNGELKVKKIIKVKLKDLTEFGTKKLKLHKDEFFIAVISANTGLVDYKFSTTGKKRRR